MHFGNLCSLKNKLVEESVDQSESYSGSLKEKSYYTDCSIDDDEGKEK